MEAKENNTTDEILFSENENGEQKNVILIGADGRHKRHHHLSSHRSTNSHRSKHRHFSSHRSSSHSKKRRKKEKKNNGHKFIFRMRTLLKYVPVVIVVIMIGVMIVLISYYEGSITSLRDMNNKEPEKLELLDGEFAVHPTYFEGDVDIISDVAKRCAFLDSDISFENEVEGYYNDYKIRFDTASPVVFKYDLINAPDSVKNSGYTLVISENEDYSDSTVFKFANGDVIKAEHLKTNTKYYYSVRFDSSEYGYSGSFKTSDTPRILSIDGIYNVRDIGNWETKDGKRIKQGLLYRGTELDGMVESKYKLSETGKKVMLNVLGIKFDMDLRAKDENPMGIDTLGENVEHKYYNCLLYKSVFTQNGKNTIKEIFTDLADINNYPMYMHCTHGLDRTGTVCYLLEAMLGLSDEDLKREYELSALYHRYTNMGMYEAMITSLQAYEGDTNQEKVINYLLDCEITENQMDSIRQIFLED